MCFGVVDDVPNGFSKLPIGHPDLKPSIGACCTKKEGSAQLSVNESGIAPTFSGVGVFHVNGRESKSTVYPCWDAPGVHAKFERTQFVFNSCPVQMDHGSLPQANKIAER